jgi:hypothetical protein
MTVFMVWTYVVKPEKQADLDALLQRLNKFMKEHPEKFPGLKSYKAFTHKIGSMGTYVEFYEFPDMGVAEKFLDFGYQDKDHLKFWEDWMTQIVPETYTMHLWSPLLEHSFK